MQGKTLYRRYSIRLLITCTLIACIVALINFVVDPYEVFSDRRMPGINAIKPSATERPRVFKPYQAQRLAPKTIIGGNSRPEMGLNPDNTCWKSSEQPVYNMGIPGASFYQQSLYALHAVNAGNGNKIMMGVDFLDFLVDASQSATLTNVDEIAYSEDMLRLSPNVTGASEFDHVRQRIKDQLTSLFSLNALVDSSTTILLQHSNRTGTRDTNGFNPYLEFNYIIQSEGQWVLFEQKKQELLTYFQRPNLAIRYADNTLSPDFDDLRKFLEESRARNIKVILFINPYHLDYFKLIAQVQLWPAFEEWKNEILRIAQAYQVELWDFNTIDQFTTETPPDRGVLNERLQWFAEPAHYLSELGDLMLSSMLERQCSSFGNAELFGIQLKRDTIDKHLDTLRHAVMDSL